MKLFSLLVLLYAFLVKICMGEYTLPKFVCTPMPLDMDCQPNMQRHSPSGGGHFVGMQEEAKETILHLRETVVHQKETILDQRETIRELTVKLSRCEGYHHNRGHEEGYGHSSEHEQEREHGYNEKFGQESAHGHESPNGHESGHGHERENGHKREHGHEWEEGHDREHGHEWEHGKEREHGHKIEHGHEWEEGHERDYGHERDHGHEQVHSYDREHPHGIDDVHGHVRDHDYHHVNHRAYREQPAHVSNYRKSSSPPNTMEDPPEVTSPGAPQMERMLESLKDRLDHLQRTRNSSLFSTSLRDTLQKKISVLEHQLHESHNTTEHNEKDHDHEDSVRHKMDNVLHGSEKGHKTEKQSNDFRVSFPLRTNYMYAKVKRTLYHEIFAFTICLWLKSTSSPGVGTPFSYSVPGQANEIVLIEWGNNPMELLINDKAVTLPLAINDAKWHHICVTWSSRDGLWESYLDGVRRGNGENLAPWHPIKPGGIFILGQEQDTLGGRFDSTQAFVGEISDFDMWSHVLTSGEVYKLATCAAHSTGDVIEWTESTLELHGGVTKLPFNSCQ